MRTIFISRIFKTILLCFLFLSCSSDLNFDQANDLILKPVYVANLAYFNTTASELVDDGNGQMVYEEQEFDAFKEEVFRDHLVKAKLDFEIENTIARSFTLDIVLIGANDQILETISFAIPAYATGGTSIQKTTETFENQRLDLLKQTAKIGFRVRVTSGVPLDPNSVGSLKLQSSATLYMEFE